MHSPTHSLGESSAQPSTPCSASGECGGSRSMVGRASPRAAFCRRVFFKSAAAPAVSETESIMAHSITAGKHSQQAKVVFLFHKVIRRHRRFFQNCSSRREEALILPNSSRVCGLHEKVLTRIPRIITNQKRQFEF